MNPKIPQKFMINPNIQKNHHTKNQVIWHLFGMEKKFIKLSKQRCDTHCHTYIQKIITQQWNMIKLQTQHHKFQQDVQFKHTKFHNHWIKSHHFTRDMASKVQESTHVNNPQAKTFFIHAQFLEKQSKNTRHNEEHNAKIPMPFGSSIIYL